MDQTSIRVALSCLVLVIYIGVALPLLVRSLGELFGIVGLKVRSFIARSRAVWSARQFTLRQLLLFVVLIAGVLVFLRRPVEYCVGYRQGRIEADAQWQLGSPTIYVHGNMFLFDNNRDVTTGLPYQHIGWFVDSYDRGRAKGHNDRMQTLLASSPGQARVLSAK